VGQRARGQRGIEVESRLGPADTWSTGCPIAWKRLGACYHFTDVLKDIQPTHACIGL
jgi:hypothetical protein